MSLVENVVVVGGVDMATGALSQLDSYSRKPQIMRHYLYSIGKKCVKYLRDF